MGQPQAPIWNIPYQRNPLFTGREDVLKRLYEALRSGRAAALAQPQAITGLGGIGKTQAAVEYAYRYRDDYKSILWVKAEMEGSIISDFVTIANLLNLPEKQEQDQHSIVEAVKRWFQEHPDWLVIFDNADDLAIVQRYMQLGDKGQILLTTRAYATGRIANRIEVEKMEPEEGALFLLHRAKLIDPNASLDAAPQSDRDKSLEIVQAMDGLPLALDQAGAYMEETRCGLQGYLQLFRAQGAELLKERGELASDHPDPVATTWSLSFKNVERVNAAAAELLRFCAFHAPDAIPEDLFAQSAVDLGQTLGPVAADPFSFNTAIKELLKYSLVQRDPETNTLSIHRLVQEVLKDQMDEGTQSLWAERTVRAVNRVFPEVEVAKWSDCERYLPHAQICMKLIDHYTLVFLEAGRLLYETGRYLRARAQNAQAEPLFIKALEIHEQVLGDRDADTASTLHDLAWLYLDQGRYKEAEPLYQRAFNIRKKVLGTKDPHTAYSLQCLARLYSNQGLYDQAESLLEDALKIRDQVSGAKDANAASILYYLAWFYRDIRQYAESELLYKDALEIRKQVLGLQDLQTADTMNDLGWLYQDQRQFDRAEPLLKDALMIRKQVLRSPHPQTANTLHALAWLYKEKGQYEEAERLLKETLSIREKVQGPQHFDTANVLHDLAKVYEDQGKYEEAEPLYQRALAIREKTLPPDHPNIASTLANYANLLQKMNRNEEAEPLE
jgi:tetratricopeptide (TPR) repeat protein